MSAKTGGVMQVDLELVRQLAELLNETGLTEIEVEDSDRAGWRFCSYCGSLCCATCGCGWCRCSACSGCGPG
jgi:hypothetical protein